jgi:hypothetical protein
MIIEVGKPIEQVKKRYQESVKFDFTDGGFILYLFFNQPTDQEIQDIKKGRAEIGYYQRDDVIFILCRFGSTPYMDAPYNVHLSKQLTHIDEPGPGKGYGLHIILIDARDGIVKAQRLIGLGHDFSVKLYQAIKRQLTEPFNSQHYMQTIQSVYAAHPTQKLIKYADAFYKLEAERS